jgi:hypothetical protein
MVAAGQDVSYVLQQDPSEKTAFPTELIDGPVQYDVEKYTQLILEAVTGMLFPLVQHGLVACSNSRNGSY